MAIRGRLAFSDFSFSETRRGFVLFTLDSRILVRASRLGLVETTRLKCLSVAGLTPRHASTQESARPCFVFHRLGFRVKSLLLVAERYEG